MKAFHRSLPSTLGAQSNNKDVHVLANSVRAIENYLLDLQKSIKALSENKTPDGSQTPVVEEPDTTGTGTTDHGALTGLSDDDHAQYLLLAGRGSGQVIANPSSIEPTLEIKRYSNAGGDIFQWQKEDGTELGHIDNLGCINVELGVNSTTPLVTLTQGPTGGVLDPNVSLLLDTGTAVTTFDRAALEVRAGPSGGYRVAHINYKGQFHSDGKYDNTGVSIGAPYDDPTYDENALLIEGFSRSVILNMQAITSGQQRIVTFPDKDGTVAMLDDIPAIPSSYATVQDEGTSVTQRATVDFVGDGVSVADDSINLKTIVTINAGSGSGISMAASMGAGAY
jgi:hypothetical protein